MASGAAEGTPAGVDAAAPRRRLAWVFGVVACIVALDQLTKSWAVAALADGPVSVVGDTVELRLARNPGSAFGRFQGYTPLLAVGAVVVTLVLVRMARRATDRWLLAGLVLLLGGALGNLADRVFRAPGFLRGHVVDFVSVGWWPLFNVADSCITIGAVILVVHTLRQPS
ncbi:MAG: lipoprotein signal peptidase [Acidimicrobiia bacterium]|nr:MAG: lipoprotein signal peptidase [Acidimicrobiia bacterium]